MGFVGNIAIILIISKWRDLCSGAAFMFSLALADLESIVIDGVIHELLHLHEFSLDLINRPVCSLFTYISKMTTAASYLITALFSVDKCLAVIFPFKYKEFGKPKICVWATFLVYVFVSLVFSPFLFVIDLDKEKRACSISNFEKISADTYFRVVLPMTITVNSILPLLVIIFCTIATIKILQVNSRKRENHAQNGGASTSARDRLDTEITRQMIAVCGLFCVLSVAATIVYKLNYDSQIKTAYELAVFNFLDRVNSMLTSMINASNFYLYLLFGKKFRADFKSLFCCKCGNN